MNARWKQRCATAVVWFMFGMAILFTVAGAYGMRGR